MLVARQAFVVMLCNALTAGNQTQLGTCTQLPPLPLPLASEAPAGAARAGTSFGGEIAASEARSLPLELRFCFPRSLSFPLLPCLPTLIALFLPHFVVPATT